MVGNDVTEMVGNQTFVQHYKDFLALDLPFTQAQLNEHIGYTGANAGSDHGQILHAYVTYINENTLYFIQSEHLTDANFQFQISPNRKMYGTTEFVKALQDMATLLNRNLTKTGLVAAWTSGGVETVAAQDVNAERDVIQYLNFYTTNDGSLELKGTRNFWNAFYIEFTAYGASLLGIKLSQLQNHLNHYYLAATGNSFTTPFIAAVQVGQNPIVTEHQLQAPLNTLETLTFVFDTPIYQSCDQRVSISVTSHLSILSNVKVENGQQKADRTIAEAFFENTVTSEMTRTDTRFETKLTSKIYAGQMNLIRKSDMYHEWHRLLTSFDAKFFRFYIHKTYRVFNIQTEKWSIETTPLKIEEDDYWLLQIRFVSDV
jgi:hypothetical protein